MERHRQQQTVSFCLDELMNCCMVFDSWTQSWQVIHHSFFCLCSVRVDYETGYSPSEMSLCSVF